MHRASPRPYRLASQLVSAVLGAVVLGACSDQPVVPAQARDVLPGSTLQAFDCVASRAGMTCAPAAPGTGSALGTLVGGQNTYVRLSSANAGYNAGEETFS